MVNCRACHSLGFGAQHDLPRASRVQCRAVAEHGAALAEHRETSQTCGAQTARLEKSQPTCPTARFRPYSCRPMYSTVHDMCYTLCRVTALREEVLTTSIRASAESAFPRMPAKNVHFLRWRCSTVTTVQCSIRRIRLGVPPNDVTGCAWPHNYARLGDFNRDPAAVPGGSCGSFASGSSAGLTTAQLGGRCIIQASCVRFCVRPECRGR